MAGDAETVVVVLRTEPGVGPKNLKTSTMFDSREMFLTFMVYVMHMQTIPKAIFFLFESPTMIKLLRFCLVL